MSVNMNNVTNAGISLPDVTKKTATADNSLGKDAFLKLLAAQARSQDPMAPSDNTQQIAQLAQFSSLEQMQNVANEMALVRSSINNQSSIALVGKDVDYLTEEGVTTTGTVAGVSLTADGPMLTIGEAKDVPVASVVTVR